MPTPSQRCADGNSHYQPERHANREPNSPSHEQSHHGATHDAVIDPFGEALDFAQRVAYAHPDCTTDLDAHVQSNERPQRAADCEPDAPPQRAAEHVAIQPSNVEPNSSAHGHADARPIVWSHGLPDASTVVSALRDTVKPTVNRAPSRADVDADDAADLVSHITAKRSTDAGPNTSAEPASYAVADGKPYGLADPGSEPNSDGRANSCADILPKPGAHGFANYAANRGANVDSDCCALATPERRADIESIDVTEFGTQHAPHDRTHLGPDGLPEHGADVVAPLGADRGAESISLITPHDTSLDRTDHQTHGDAFRHTNLAALGNADRGRAYDIAFADPDNAAIGSADRRAYDIAFADPDNAAIGSADRRAYDIAFADPDNAAIGSADRRAYDIAFADPDNAAIGSADRRAYDIAFADPDNAAIGSADRRAYDIAFADPDNAAFQRADTGSIAISGAHLDADSHVDSNADAVERPLTRAVRNLVPYPAAFARSVARALGLHALRRLFCLRKPIVRRRDMVLHGDSSPNAVAYTCEPEEYGMLCGYSAYFTCGCKPSALASCYSHCSDQTWALEACRRCQEATVSPRYPRW
ncbi:hypothetical protein CTAYLR_001649 [Chrysophaeum taylorii]|uniref:Uncharacterized protein n=1 Tax=Chrysophaeum taylorii TaxID=2483200 RepID=A0AAD7UCT4_9STRA|nr:hypothetical protein CTAYLR_001649 [Chrysophaeum taylorii]